MLDFNTLPELNLPPPVEHYFRRVLKDKCPMISEVHLRQKGKLRLDTSSSKWFSFDAAYNAKVRNIYFSWQANIKIARFLKLKVTDSYIDHVGSGEVRFWSTKIAKSSGGFEMNSGSLHRYLAELVWCPTALLPGNGLEWTPLSNERALATLKSGNIKVALEFIFNSSDEIAGIYSSGRWGKFKTGFSQKPWEGHFSNYVDVEGYRVPGYGEVGWYDQGIWKSVWEARISNVIFRGEKGEMI